ncbi:anti sigma factor C-terminal domain-containing protein [Enterococcus canis]|nr:anti sigma factor C-terminal domain-containing protein [Enterococcus canis]
MKNSPKFDFEKIQAQTKQKWRLSMVKVILLSVILTLLLLLGGQALLNRFYYDPQRGNEVAVSTSYVFNRFIQNQLTQPNSVLADFQINRTGIGTYGISEIFETNSQSSQTQQSSQIKRNKQSKDISLRSRTIGNTTLFSDEEVQRKLIEPDQLDALLESSRELPRSSQLTLNVLFKKDLSLDEYAHWTTYNAPTSDTLWYAVRTKKRAENERPYIVGFSPNGHSGQLPELKETPQLQEKYPLLNSFWATDEQNKWSDEKRETTRFTSMLRYLQSQTDFINLASEGEQPLSEKQIAETLAYVEEHGVKIYGATVTLSVQNLELLLKSEDLAAAYLTEVALIRL